MKVEVKPCPCGLPVREHSIGYEIQHAGWLFWTIRLLHGPGRFEPGLFGGPLARTRKRAIRKGERLMQKELGAR